MPMIDCIWYRTPFENITSSPNNNEISSASMHTTPEVHQRFQFITNYVVDEVDREMESVPMLVMMNMMMEIIPIHAKEGLVTMMATIF
jgi:hypothetical protein